MQAHMACDARIWGVADSSTKLVEIGGKVFKYIAKLH